MAKKILALALVFALVLSVPFASAAEAGLADLALGESKEVGMYTVTNFGNDVWHVEDSTAANPRGFQFDETGAMVGMNNCSDMYVVLGEDKAMLVDLSNQYSDGYADITAVFDELAGEREQIIWITHAHPDHVGQFPAFKEAGYTVYITTDDYDGLDAYVGLGMDKTLVTPIGYDESIDLGGRTFEIVHVPGHTDGSNVLYEVETKIGFSADSVGSGSGVWLFGEFEELEVGLKNLLEVIDNELGGEVTLYGGHTWQQHNATLGYVEMDRQYVADMQTLIENIKTGGEYTASYLGYYNPALDTNFTYGKATITVAKYKAVKLALENGVVLNPFADVAGKDTTEAVTRLYAEGFIKGTGYDTFEPAATMTRAEFITLLGRAAKATVDHKAAPSFPDVVNDGWSTGYIAWGVENGLILGYEDGTYKPNDAITRTEVNLILDRFNEAFDTEIPLYNEEQIHFAQNTNATRGSFAVLLAAGLTYTPTEPVEVTGGTVVGYKSIDGEIDIYKGIPFAAPPVGELRWQAPQPVEPWEGTLNATTWSASAVQGYQGPFAMWSTEFIIEDTGYNEDCLYLNVWTNGTETAGKPVIVYIHGGGFTSGGAACEVYDGEYIASRDVVYVAINYRVASFGFLASSELSEEQGGHSGNYGIMDQIAALKWVQENIEQFGGDPANVTIMGQSAGSMSVNTLVASPLAAGLFVNAVAESGNSILTVPSDLDTAEASVDDLGYTLEELRAMSAEEVLALPSPGVINDGYVMTDSYAEMYLSGDANKVNMMTGMTEDDTALFGVIPTMFGFMTYDLAGYEAAAAQAFGDYADEVLALYPATEENVMQVVQDLNSDVNIFQQGMLALARTMGGNGDTYLYNFEHIMQDATGGAAFGAFHTSDVPYFLQVYSNHRDAYWNEADYTMGQIMSDYLINFAKTGDPNGDTVPQWAPSTGVDHYQELNVTTVESSLSQEKIDLFTAIYTAMLLG